MTDREKSHGNDKEVDRGEGICMIVLIPVLHNTVISYQDVLRPGPFQWW